MRPRADCCTIQSRQSRHVLSRVALQLRVCAQARTGRLPKSQEFNTSSIRDPQTHPPLRQSASNHHNGSRLENRRSYVRSAPHQLSPKDTAVNALHSYNRYISVASRVIRRSLKEEQRIIAERRGQSELRFAKWEVSLRQMGAWSTAAWRLTTGRMASRARSRS